MTATAVTPFASFGSSNPYTRPCSSGSELNTLIGTGFPSLIIQSSYARPGRSRLETERVNKPASLLHVPEELIPLLALTEVEFRERFRGSPIRRAKWAGLRRNICVALGNGGDPAAIPALLAVLGEDPPLVRGHAAWALGRLAGPSAQAALSARLPLEDDAWVREEIIAALAEMGEA